MTRPIEAHAGTHDERGNLVERLHNGWTTAFEWDAFGRMTQATSADTTTRYVYNPLRLGRRHLGL